MMLHLDDVQREGLIGCKKCLEYHASTGDAKGNSTSLKLGYLLGKTKYMKQCLLYKGCGRLSIPKCI